MEDYYNKNPQFFAQRKQFSMNELVLATKDLTPELKAAADAAKSIDEVAAWMDAHKIRFGRTQVARSTTDLTPGHVGQAAVAAQGPAVLRQGRRAQPADFDCRSQARRR